MNKKKILTVVISIVIASALALLYGVHMIRENYQLGGELLSAANEMSVYSGRLAQNMRSLENYIEEDDIDGINSCKCVFDFSLGSAIEGFRHQDEDILFDARTWWVYKFWELRGETQMRRDMEFYFTHKSDEAAELLNKLDNMTSVFIDFRERYNQMSKWEKYFTCWSDEQEIISEKLRLS